MKKGTFDYKKKKKEKKKVNSKKELQKRLLKEDKKVKKQCKCNHIGRNTRKTHFEKIYDGGNHIYNKCKICGAKMITDTSMLTPEAIETAAEQLITVYALARLKTNMAPSLNSDITKFMYFARKAPSVVKELSEMNTKKKNKKNKKNKKKNKKKKGRRFNY